MSDQVSEALAEEKKDLEKSGMSQGRAQKGMHKSHSDANLKSKNRDASTGVRPTEIQCADNKNTLNKNTLMVLIKRNNMELQFWGYETGNVLATIAGAGGFLSFFYAIEAVLQNNTTGGAAAVQQLLTRFPDATVTIGLGLIVLIVPTLRTRVFSELSSHWLNIMDSAITFIALGIFCYAIILDTSWIAIGSSSFVVASCFLRQCRENPLLIKAGGLALVCGGIGLALFGLQVALPIAFEKDYSVIAMGTLTLATGIYVVFAGFLTYEGGIFATRDFISKKGGRTDDVWMNKLAHPKEGFLARRVFVHTDKSIMELNNYLSKPAIFWVSEYTKNHKPFKTSMLARLPWRVLTGAAALISLTPTGFAFFTANVCWAIGDVAIGSEDW